ncbi:hypothetical protein ACI79D_02285 [Geodermatophilus sp. SYSU D00708]
MSTSRASLETDDHPVDQADLRRAALGVGSQGAFYAEVFGARYRYAGISLAREFSSVFGRGIAPLVSSALITWASGSWWPVAVYTMGMIGISAVAMLLSPETRGRDLRLEDDAVPGRRPVAA